MRRGVAAAILATLVVGAGVAHAGRHETEESDVSDAGTTEDQLVLVNAAAKLGDIGQISRLRRVLDKRGLLYKLPEHLEAALDGRASMISDLDVIKDAYSQADYETALKVINADQERILDEAINRDPIPALAELSQWRGLIASALNQREDAVRWFRAARWFNPAWAIDKKLVSRRTRSMLKESRHEPSSTGTLRVEVDPDDASITIDGGEAKPANDKFRLRVGTHLVVVTARGRKPYADLVDIQEDQTEPFEISLEHETEYDRAARLADESAAAPAGKPRLRRAKALARLTGAKRMLFVEEGGDDHVIVRLYDVRLRKVSRALELEGSASSAAIARKVTAALDPDNLVDVSTVHVQVDGPAKPKAWYQHWYVWAALGAVAVGGYAGYEYMTREPTSIRGF